MPAGKDDGAVPRLCTPNLSSRRMEPSGSPDSSSLERAFLLALHGRYEARSAHLIAQLVLFRLEGRPTVRSSQLASEAMAALHMHDDIAYLDAGTTKAYKSVQDFREKAIALLDRLFLASFLSQSGFAGGRPLGQL